MLQNIAVFGAGLLVGGFVGLFTAALCKISKMSDGFVRGYSSAVLRACL